MITLKSTLSISAAICLLMVVGCAGDKSKKSEAAPAAPKPQPVSLTQLKSELLQSKAQVQVTNDSLMQLQKSAPGDAEGNYNKFTEQYMKLNAMSEALKARANDLKARATAYHEKWNKQISVENPELRKGAMQQKADAEQVFNTIGNEMELARMTYNTYAQDLKDVGNYLRGNLSPASLSSASDLVAKADGESKQVMKHLDAIVGAVDKIASATGETAPSTQPGAVAPMAK